MRYAIDTAPKDGKVVILEDDASGTYDVAHWSVEAGNWIGEDSEPSKITPTHWYAMPDDRYVLSEDDRSGGQVAPSASRARNHNFFRRFNFFRFSSNRSAPRRPTAASDVIARCPAGSAAPMNAAVGAQTAPVKAKRAPHARWRFSAFSITAGVIGALLICMYLFRAEIAARYSGYLYLDVARSAATDGKAVDEESQRPQGATVELRQFLQQERDRAQALERELATARRQSAWRHE